MASNGITFGVSIGVSPRESFWHTVEVVQSAERFGFDSAWIADVHLSMKNCFIAMALCASNTQRIKLGTGVLNPVSRHPADLVNALSGIQELSNGRCLMGLGTGYSSVYPLALKPAPIDEMREAVLLCRALFAGGSYSYHGADIQMTVAQPGVPIYIAANQQRMLRLAGEVADGVILMGGANAEFTRWQIALVRQGAEAAGRNFDDIALDLWFNMSVSDDRQKAFEDVRPWVASQADTFNRWRELPDFLEPYRDEFQLAASSYNRLEHVSRHAVHKDAVSDELVRLLAVAGTPAECRERLHELADLGIRRMTIGIVGGGRAERMRMISEEVMPEFVSTRT